MTTQSTQTKAVQTIGTMDMKTLILTQPKKQFIASGGTDEQFVKEAGFALQMIRNNDFLAKMDRQSIIDSIVNVALTGLTLNPELKLGYLIPRKGKCYFQSSYMGKREILFRAGMVKNIWVNLVHEKDGFEFLEGSERKITHNTDFFGKDRGEVIGGYWVGILQTGEKMMGTMSRQRIEQIKARSEAVKAGKGSPWDTDPEEMMKKTIINAAFKELPKTGISDNVLKAMEADSQVDQLDMKDWLKAQEQGQEHDLDNDTPANNEIQEAQIIEDPKSNKDQEEKPPTLEQKTTENKENKLRF